MHFRHSCLGFVSLSFYFFAVLYKTMQLDFTVQGFFCEGFFLIFGEIGCKFTSYINCGWQASVCTSGRIEGNA